MGLNGAWLIRNSWGDDNNNANGGYFWLPYNDFNTDDIFYAVDADVANKYKYNYHYDTTNTLSTYNYHGLGKLANIFKVSSDMDQVLDAVNIAWQSANIDYEIDIYTNDNQMSDPEDGTHILNQSVHNEAAGIKTVPLDKNVLLLKDSYFSIIVKANDYESIIFADYASKQDDADRYYYNEVKLGESFENDDGTWRDLNESLIYEIEGKKYGCSPRIRGLTDEARVIRFDPGEGTGTMLPQGIKYGDTDKIDPNTFTKDGYTFYKWIDEDGNKYDNEEYVVLSNDITLTALWEEVPPPTPPAPTPSPAPSPSGGDSGSSGGSSGGSGGSGSGPILPSTNAIESIEVSTLKTSYPALESSYISWVYDPKVNKFKLNIDINGQNVPATNGFFTLNEVETAIVNNIQVKVTKQNTYYFKKEGDMVTGFVKTYDDKTYYFETAKTKDEGKMIIGWKFINSDWYYFSNDGSMLLNATTPDGYIVGIDGKYRK